jgi:hypothetical protein
MVKAISRTEPERLGRRRHRFRKPNDESLVGSAHSFDVSYVPPQPW